MKPWSRSFRAAILLCAGATVGAAWAVHAVENAVPAVPRRDTRPAPALPVPPGAQQATFAAGCFWGLEEALRQVPGVLDTRAGYTGGSLAYPTYEQIHRQGSGHVEAVTVAYDPHRVSYHHLLTVFFASHNPTWPTTQKRASGSPYRSFVFTHTPAQADEAQEFVRSLQHTRKYAGAPLLIQTQLRPASTFWPAERYHQQYYAQRGMTNACGL